MDFPLEPIVDLDVPLRAPDGERVAAHVVGGDVEHPQFRRVGMVVRAERLGEKEYVEGDLFWCLIAFRREIEPLGWRVLCNGARRNTWPSGMLGDMSAGTKTFLLVEPRRRGLPEIVEVFDEAPESEVVTVQEQEAYRDAYHGRARAGP